MNDKLSAVIMAAGKGTRLNPLTQTYPKPLIKVLGKGSLEYNLENLVGKVDEAVIVVGYRHEKIRNYFGLNFKGIKIKYANQKKPQGTAHALYVSKDKVSNSEMIVMNGDDVYSKELIDKILNSDSGIIGKKVKKWQNYGILKRNSDNFLDRIIEKPNDFIGDLANIGLYKVNSDIFNYYSKVKRSVRGEYELTDLLTEYAKNKKVEVISCNKGWSSLSYPWNLLQLAEEKVKEIKEDIKGKIEKGVTILGKIHLGKNSKIKSGSYLEGNFYIGENCQIGPNCYLKGYASIDDDSNVGSAVEITRSIIGNGTNIKHMSYIGDSIIGNNVNIGAGTKVANLRHDNFNVKVVVNGKLVDTGKRKFGIILGDNVKTGINTLLYPGSMINSNGFTYPGEVFRYKTDKKQFAINEFSKSYTRK